MKLEDSVWVHTTYRMFGTQNVPSNGMIVQTSEGVILIDTPWDDTLTAHLLDSMKERFNQPVLYAMITHAHDDRIGGIAALHKHHIKVMSQQKTCELAKKYGYEIPDTVMPADTILTSGNERLEYFYPGPGHTEDNSVVWLQNRNILFGGCLVKAESYSDLGNIADANLSAWPQTIHRLIEKYSSARIIVPGHGTWGGLPLLQHTLHLLEKRNEQ